MVDWFDGGLLRVLLQGPRALPDDLARLEGYLNVVRRFLEEFAQEVDSDWDAEMRRASEVEALLELEEQITTKVADVRAETVRGVMYKLRIWEGILDAEFDEYERPAKDEIVHSACIDLEAIIASVATKFQCRNCPAWSAGA